MADLPQFIQVGDDDHAFGAPGLDPTWASSDKDCVTTSLGTARVWATIGHGVLNEVYWPSTGEPQLRDLTFYLIGSNGWIDLKRVRRCTIRTPAPFLPLPTIVHHGDDYSLELEFLPDPNRDTLLIRYSVTGPYRLAVIAAPHLDVDGRDNAGWVDGALFAHRRRRVLCVSADTPFANQSVGYVGQSDGWQDLVAHGRLTYGFTKAGPGNVALTAELTTPTGVLAIGFSNSARGAWTLAQSSVAEGFDAARSEFLRQWALWGENLRLPAPTPELAELAQLSATVLKMHEDRSYPGAIVASLSTPWGDTSDTLGGYHLVWPRDATLGAFALIAADQVPDAERILARFIATQEADGHWAQNTYPSGEPFWTGLQLDETAFPVLLAAKLRELGTRELPGTGAMVARAIRYIIRTGPSSDQDRWEENPGVSTFTVAVAVAALVGAASWLPDDERTQVLAIADEWCERVDEWCYVTDTDLTRHLAIDGYYVRLAPPFTDGAQTGQIPLRNRMGEDILASALVSMDFSYLVRLGLRQATDPRITDTIAVADHVLKVATPSGDVYLRYNEDGYGEHLNGSPFDGSGIGRPWPILTGERGHLALQRGDDPTPYIQTMANCAGVGGLLPEQVWDGEPIPSRGLVPGKPTGSATPLVWAHAEFLKLLVAHEAGRPVELLRDVELRYATPRAATAWRWRNETPVKLLPAERDLVIEHPEWFTAHVGFDGWNDVHDIAATEDRHGLWCVSVPASELAGHTSIEFTRRFANDATEADHSVQLGSVG